MGEEGKPAPTATAHAGLQHKEPAHDGLGVAGNLSINLV